jgi:TPR repeat protein
LRAWRAPAVAEEEYPVEQPAEASAPGTEAPKPEDEAEHAPKPDSPTAYLADVRKSVAAAAVAAEATAAARKSTTSKVCSRLTRYLVGSVGVIAVFAAGAGVAFSMGESDGRIDAVRHVTHHAATPVAASEAGRSSLDRLADRARAGDPRAELAVGIRYLKDPNKDEAAAFHWITLAAVHGQPVAQFRLATLYASGTGTPADPAHALQWYEAAALQGNRKAMHDLGVAYAEGLGTSKNPTEAVRWLSRAAGFGFVDSQFDLAVLYERGEGVPQSLLDAYKWYAVAGRQGDQESKDRIDALKTQLSSDDIAVAEQAASSFRAMPYNTAANAL